MMLAHRLAFASNIIRLWPSANSSKTRCFFSSIIWQPIPNYSNYEASNCGDIRSKKTKQVLKQAERNHKNVVYLRKDNGAKTTRFVGRVILSTFQPHPNEQNLYASHKDGDVRNNHVDNLEWNTKSSISKLRVQRKGCNWEQAVILKKFEGKRLVEVTKCASVKECLCNMNNYFDGTVKRCRPVENSFFVYPCPTSSKTCTVEYVDKSRCDTSVEPIDSNEEWKPFHQGLKEQRYFVSNYGRVKVVYKHGNERLRKLADVDGYMHVSISIQQKRKFTKVHRLVANMFVENAHDLDCIDHIDGNPSNNIASNLKWVKDMSENMKNTITRTRMINNNRILQYDKQTNEFVREWPNANSVSKKLGYTSSYILRCCRGESMTAYGYRWEFVEKNQLK